MASRRDVDVLIVGAGLAGLLLARELRTHGRSVAVAHDPARPGASEAAVGLLNPVRGQRCTLAWRARETWDAARRVYGEIARAHGTPVWRDVTVVRAFATADERAAFDRRAEAIAAAGFAARPLASPPPGLRDAGHGIVAIDGGGALDARNLIAALRDEARAAGVLLERRCVPTDLLPGAGSFTWRDVDLEAARVVLAGGIEDLAPCLAAPLPLRPVRGESLLVRARALDEQAAFVCGHHLAPIGAGLWSCGGTKEPGDATRATTAAGRAELELFLTRHLAVPWEVVGHACGVRAATLDTRPLVGPVDTRGRVFAFNGFGSQGYAVAPWLARLLANHLVSGMSLPPEVDPARFAARPVVGDVQRWHAVDVARAITTAALAPGDLAIDLTAGNGGDTLALAGAVGVDGAVLALDIQPAAVDATRRRLEREGCETPVDLRCADHAALATLVAADWRGRVGAVVANLGYLPGSDSPVTTRPESTLAAFLAALELLRRGGVLVAVIYLQHEGGAAELAAIERWAPTLDPACVRVAWQRATDRSPRAPVVFSATRV